MTFASIKKWLSAKWYKTQPFKHQVQALLLSALAPFFALLMEQGTGKSWVIVLTVAILRRMGLIDTVLIIAPKGVAPGWIRQQFPEHMPDDVPYVAALWKPASRMTKRNQREVDAVLREKEVLRVIVMNTEAFGSTEDAVDFAIGLLDDSQSALVVVDESHRIKTHDTHTTKRIINLRIRSAYRRILTGTVADKPFDVWSQFGFLSPTILNSPSFTAFKGEYAEMMPPQAGLMRHILQRVPKVWKGKYKDADSNTPQLTPFNADGTRREKLMEPSYIPQIVAQNADGTPRYKNLDRLQALIAPHSYRVLKRDCLDLPEKVYSRYYTELEDRQAALYAQVRDTHRIEWEEGRMTVLNKLTVYLRLQQIICGYLPDEGRLVELFPSWKANPRVVSMLELISDRPPSERAIIWCRFIPDILRVSEALREAYGEGSVVQFYGAVNDRDRDEAVARFQGERIIMKNGKVLRREEVLEKDRAKFMVAQQQAGGVGQTWTAATLSHHYSNTFSLIDRLQAEDRPHRIGQRNAVQYIDLEAEDTIDTHIITSLVAKKGVADTINGDEGVRWLQ